jgi:hypothetical protein
VASLHMIIEAGQRWQKPNICLRATHFALGRRGKREKNQEENSNGFCGLQRRLVV